MTKDGEGDDEGHRVVTFEKVMPIPEILHYAHHTAVVIDGEEVSLWIGVIENGEIVSARKPTLIERQVLQFPGPKTAYEWAIAHWGTKWDPDGGYVDGDPEEGAVTLIFDTAWSPPAPIAALVRDLWPEVGLSAFYNEPGMELAGYL